MRKGRRWCGAVLDFSAPTRKCGVGGGGGKHTGWCGFWFRRGGTFVWKLFRKRPLGELHRSKRTQASVVYHANSQRSVTLRRGAVSNIVRRHFFSCGPPFRCHLQSRLIRARVPDGHRRPRSTSVAALQNPAFYNSKRLNGINFFARILPLLIFLTG